MIRGQRFCSVAVRRPTGDIHSTTWPLSTIYTGALRRIPLVRGVIVLVETLVLGMKALTFSANAAVGEEDRQVGRWAIGATLVLALVLGVGIFFVAPLFVAQRLDPFIASDLASNFVEGLIRLAIFLAYVWAIGLMGEIKRVFAYHGAEHMTVHALEAGTPLDVEHVRPFHTAHPRCGTAFLLVVMVVAILVFALLGRPDVYLRVLSRIVLVPAIAGVSYEVIRFSGAHAGNVLVRAIMAPSLALQKLTTRRPDDGQIEVAIQAMQKAIAADQPEPEAPPVVTQESEAPPQGG
ncbi:MAG: DUF1385 domain-containing protein [Chloroflexi bacterium]|nr:DUF1385 domain-containing protein [Chloroflexota bacterium]